MPSASSLYPRLSNFYFFYFVLFGAMVPYASLYFQSVGFNAIQIGQLMAVFVGTKIIAPNILGWLADRCRCPIYWLRWAAFLTVVSSMAFAMTETFGGLLLTLFWFSFFFHGALPLFESYTFTALSGGKSKYGQVRLWGSLGFIAATLVVGWLIEQQSIGILPMVLIISAVVIWLSSYWVSELPNQSEHLNGESFWQIIRQPWVASLLIVSILMQFSHGTYYSFYSIFLAENGYSKTAIAWLWSLGVIAEIAVFFWMANLFQRWSVKTLLMISLGLTLIRWVMIPFVPDSLALLIVAQLLHAASYGLFHAAAIYMIDQHFQGANQSKGQAIYASASHGLGGAFGMLAAGYAWYEGGALLAFAISALAIVLALLIAQKWIHNE